MAAEQAAENHGDETINFKLKPLTKFTSSSRNTKFKDILLWNILSDHKDPTNQHKNSHKLCNEMRHPSVSLTENQ